LLCLVTLCISWVSVEEAVSGEYSREIEIQILSSR
jgi:hypothetical protein